VPKNPFLCWASAELVRNAWAEAPEEPS